MEVKKIDVSEVTFLTTEEYQAPTRIEFIGLEHSILSDLILIGNIHEVNVWPKSLRKLVILSTGNLVSPELPKDLNRLGIFTDHNEIPYLPEKLQHLHLIDAKGRVDVAQGKNLLSLELIGRSVSIYDLPLGVVDLTCTPEEERVDFSDFPHLAILKLKDHKGTILELGQTQLQQLTLSGCNYQKVQQLPSTLISLSLAQTIIVDGRLNLPEGLIGVDIHESKDGNGNVIPKPLLPASLQYYNGSSIVRRA